MPETEQKARQDRWGSSDLEPCSVSHMSHGESVLPLPTGCIPEEDCRGAPSGSGASASEDRFLWLLWAQRVGTGTAGRPVCYFRTQKQTCNHSLLSAAKAFRLSRERKPGPTLRRAVLLRCVTSEHGCRANQTGKGVRGTKRWGALR